MALNISLFPPTFRLNTGYLVLFTNTTGTPAMTKGVVKVTAPDGLDYFINGNTEATYQDPSTATVPNYTSNFAITELYLPRNADDTPQVGQYTVRVSGFDGTNTYYMTPLVMNFVVKSPKVVVTQTLDFIKATLKSKDETNYTVSGVIPSVTRVHSFSKVLPLPVPYTYTGAASEVTLSFPSLYSGEYTSTVTSFVVWNFGSHTVEANATAPATKKMITCSQGVCDVYCGIKTLEMNLADARSNGNATLVNQLQTKLEAIVAYITLYNQAVSCEDYTSATEYIAKIQKIGGFTNTCCDDEINYQIKPIGGPVESSLVVQYNGSTITTATNLINFTGSGVTVTTSATGNSVVNINPVSPGATGVDILEGGATVLPGAVSVNFTGNAVDVTLDPVTGQPNVAINFTAADGEYGYNISEGTTAVNLQGVPAGTLFPVGTLMKDVIKAILNPFQPPVFTGFSAPIFVAYEVGEAIPTGITTVNYSIANSTNIKNQPPGVGIPSTNLAGATFPVNPITLSGSGNFQISIAAATTLTTPGSRTINLSGTNSNNGNFSTGNTTSWLYRAYFGFSTAATLNAAGILALASSNKQSGFGTTYAIGGGADYKYVCFPDAFGSPSSFSDVGTGFGVAMATNSSDAFYSNFANGYYYGIVAVTNTFGVTANYRVYRTFNQISGLNLKVS